MEIPNYLGTYLGDQPAALEETLQQVQSSLTLSAHNMARPEYKNIRYWYRIVQNWFNSVAGPA